MGSKASVYSRGRFGPSHSLAREALEGQGCPYSNGSVLGSGPFEQRAYPVTEPQLWQACRQGVLERAAVLGGGAAEPRRIETIKASPLLPRKQIVRKRAYLSGEALFSFCCQSSSSPFPFFIIHPFSYFPAQTVLFSLSPHSSFSFSPPSSLPSLPTKLQTGEFTDFITDNLAAWILKQKLIFVSSAPLSGQGKVNVSPKGYDCFRIINPKQVCYLELTGMHFVPTPCCHSFIH